MKLSKTELLILEHIAKGNKDIPQIAKNLKKSKAQIYRSGQKLIKESFIVRSVGYYEPTKTTHVNLFLQILEAYPSTIEPLSDSGIKILTALLEPKSIREIIQETEIKRTQVFKKIKQARAISMVKIKNNKYFLNEKLWNNVIVLLKELKKYEETIDQRIPADANIYFKNEKEIVFSSKKELDASITGFSAYGQYGLKLLMNTHYYCLPKKKLTKKDIFRHSLYITEKSLEFRQIIILALFYAKYKKYLSGINHKILKNIDNIFEGQHIPGYPTLEEIKERADVYDIRL